MKILMVTPYPPMRDGIASYAVQAVAKLMAQGDEVEVLSPGPSAAHHHLDLEGVRGGLALAKRVRSFDRVIVQFHPDVFYPPPHRKRERALANLALTLAFRLAKRVEVRLHEVDYAMGRRSGLGSLAMRMMWRSVDLVEVHTQEELRRFRKAFGVPHSKVALADHGGHFVKRTSAGRSEARASLSIPNEDFMFLCIGFIQPHKGFDRAIRAFGQVTSQCRLDIVGSVRVEEPDYLQHLDDLIALADTTPGVHFHANYVSDEEFDRWIAASDVVLLPYRYIWSSGVLERAELYGRPVIATDVGGLKGQANENARLVANDAELVLAMRQAAGDNRDPADGPWTLEVTDRKAVMNEIMRRAAVNRARGGLSGSAPAASSRMTSSRATAPLRRVGSLTLPEPASKRPAAAFAKRLVKRLTGWQMDPVVMQVNRLQTAVIQALESMSDAEAGPDEPDREP